MSGPEKDPCVASREKYWEEMFPDEKIEVLMRIVTIKDLELVKLRIQIESLNDHDHQNGKMVKPFRPAPTARLKHFDLFNHSPAPSKEA